MTIRRDEGLCNEAGKCDFHRDGGPAESKCPDYCSVGECRDLVACEDACDDDGACHAHAAQWHAEQAGLLGFVTLPEDHAAPRCVSPAALGQVNTAVRAEVEALQLAIDQQVARRLDDMVRDLYGALGWQGGTVHQVKAEIARLRRAAAATERAAGIVFGKFGRTDDERVDELADALREFRPAGAPGTGDA